MVFSMFLEKEFEMCDSLKYVVPIIVTYNPDIKRLGYLIKSLVLFEDVKLIDNGSKNIESLKKLCLQYKNIETLFLEMNCGLADAQNQAVNLIEAKKRNNVFVLLLDQDSVPEDKCIDVLYNYAIQLKAQGVRLGVIGPALVDTYSDSKFGFIRDNRRFYLDEVTASFFECDGINSSGSLIPLGVWQELRGNKKELFIDHVETDWCFRARAAGYRCYGTFNAVLSHSMGESTLRYWLFGWKSMPDRAPERHYYLFRNSVFLQKQKYVPGRWKSKNILKLLLTLGYFGVFHRQRVKHISNMHTGFIDGITNRQGAKKG